MMAEQNIGKRRRLLVAMDCNAESLAGLRRAATLASGMQVELAGLFLEDVNLLRMSELPGHEISLATGSGMATSRADMERQMRRRASAARAEAERLAQAFSLSWTFEVRRAGLEHALREAAQTEELVCSAPAPPLFSHSKAPSPRVLGGELVRRPGPVLAVYEGGPGGARVLELAARAAQIHKLDLQVLVPARGSAGGTRALGKAKEALATSDMDATMRRLPLSERALLQTLATARGQLLFLDANGKAASVERLAAVREAVNCDVFLVSSQS